MKWRNLGYYYQTDDDGKRWVRIRGVNGPESRIDVCLPVLLGVMFLGFFPALNKAGGYPIQIGFGKPGELVVWIVRSTLVNFCEIHGIEFKEENGVVDGIGKVCKK